MTRQCKITVEYDGTSYHGWQIQKNGASIQGMLEMAVQRLTGEQVRVRGAGRTDAGVHARGQVASFPVPQGIPLENIPRALNSRLPDDIAVVAVTEVDETFDARRHCVMKQYSYSFMTGQLRPALNYMRCWHVKWKLDIEAMREAAGIFVGTRDFTSFCNHELSRGDNVRTVKRSEIVSLPPDPGGRPRFVYYVESRSFLYNMVRTLVGTLVAVGMGRISPAGLIDIMRARDRSAAGQTAPSCGLCLEWVLYPGEARLSDRSGLF